MSREKQIEEMDAVIRDAVNGCSSYWSGLIADALYEEGYRKQSEGEWIENKKVCFSPYCSICGAIAHKSPYCPHCGAKMKDASDRVVKFPAECSKKNCPHFKHWESGISEITCRCDLCEVDADADCEISLECPLLVKGGGA